MKHLFQGKVVSIIAWLYFHQDDELMGAVGGSASISSADLMEFSSASSYIYSVPPEINEHTELTGEYTCYVIVPSHYQDKSISINRPE